MTRSNSFQIILTPLFSLLALGACAHSAGTNPHDMNITQHEAAATREEQRAAQVTAAGPCEGGRVCWSGGDAAAAARYRELAAKHRAAAQALRDAEAKACTGLPDEDRDASPFSHYADISSVSRYYDHVPGPYSNRTHRFAGATTVIRAVPGLTTEWLQRIIDCHLARNASVGSDMPEMPDCPLVPHGVSAQVHAVSHGFAVDVRSDNDATAKEIWRRAQMLPIK